MKPMFKFARVAALLAALIAAPIAQAQILNGVNQPAPINLVDNGNFNIAQRGTGAKTVITTVPTYLWDRWAGASGTATNLTLTNITASLPSLFTNAAQVQRASGQTGVVSTCLLQETPTADFSQLQGQPITLSFWALAGSNFSAANSQITAAVTTGTGTDEGLATYLTGLTGAATPLTSAVTLTQNWQRFAITSNPTLVASTATEAVVNLCFKPVGTAGTNDYFQVTGVQLERGTVANNFEFRSLGWETNRVQRYFYSLNEGAIGSSPVGFCYAVGAQTTGTNCWIPLPVPMRTAPIVTVTTLGTFSVASTSAVLSGWEPTVSCATASNTTLGIYCHTPSIYYGTAGAVSGPLLGGGGSGILSISADF